MPIMNLLSEMWTSTVLSEVLEQFDVKNIYNADETGIYYRALPDGTLTLATERLSGSKKAKDRITALVAVNMDGSDQCPLLIIGKSKNPRCFRGVQQLPTSYTNNKLKCLDDQQHFSQLAGRLRKRYGKEKSFYCSHSGQLCCPSKRFCR